MLLSWSESFLRINIQRGGGGSDNCGDDGDGGSDNCADGSQNQDTSQNGQKQGSSPEK